MNLRMCRGLARRGNGARAGSVRLGNLFSRREYRCQPGLHRPGSVVQLRLRVASLSGCKHCSDARSLKPQSTGQHRGDPPSFALSQRLVGSERRMPSIASGRRRACFRVAQSYGWQAIKRGRPFHGQRSKLWKADRVLHISDREFESSGAALHWTYGRPPSAAHGS